MSMVSTKRKQFPLHAVAFANASVLFFFASAITIIQPFTNALARLQISDHE